MFNSLLCTYEGQVQPAKGKKVVLQLNADGTRVKK
jgi:hypothetical protein